MGEMDMEIRLDPLHNQWVILTPVDHNMQEIVNKEGFAIFRNTNGELTLSFKNPEANPTITGNLQMRWTRNNGHYPGKNVFCHFASVADFTEASEEANQFLAHIGGQMILD